MPAETVQSPAEPDAPTQPRRRAAPFVVFSVAFVVLACLAVISLALGSKPLSVTEVLTGLLAHDDSAESVIVWELRMPRTALAVTVGAALAVAGVLMQALTRNPLAEPGVLGVNAGASLTVVLAMALFGVASTSATIWFAFFGAALASGFVYAVSLRSFHDSDHARLVLAGAALTACLSSFTGVITMYDTEVFSSYRFWVIGSVADRGTDPLFAVAPPVAVGLLAALACGPMLNVLALGDEQATSLGARLPVARLATFAAITVLCGAATAAAGPISFIGLVVPHTLRLVMKADQRRLLGASIVVGPALMLAADVVGRVITPPGELEVGIVTAFIGAPVLLLLIQRRNQR